MLLSDVEQVAVDHVRDYLVTGKGAHILGAGQRECTHMVGLIERGFPRLAVGRPSGDIFTPESIDKRDSQVARIAIRQRIAPTNGPRDLQRG